MAKKGNELATVLAFEKKLVPSEGMFYGTNWEQRYDKAQATLLPLREKSVRGTISNRLKDSDKGDQLKLNADIEKPNLQTVDAVSLGFGQDTLKVKFTLKVLSGAEIPSACNVDAHREGIQEMGKAYKEKFGFSELAVRYAINLANGRYLWRNRVGAERIEVKITCPNPEKVWTFNAYDFKLQDFSNRTPEIEELAALIGEALSGTERDFLFLEIEASALLGEGQEVYPSEELILDKDKGRGNKSKVLYEVDGTAALHSQKIGNALRTIDTWYPSYSEEIGPIAIEPYGAVTNRGMAYRTKAEKVDFYTLFDRYSQKDAEAMTDESEAHYVMAVLIRGGVFGQSGKG